MTLAPTMDIAGRRQYKATCSCGWKSDRWATAPLARLEAAGHAARHDHDASVIHVSDTTRS